MMFFSSTTSLSQETDNFLLLSFAEEKTVSHYRVAIETCWTIHERENYKGTVKNFSEDGVMKWE